MNASFENLTGAVDQLLHTLQYDGHTIAAYHRFWNRLSEFMEQEGIHEFSRECGERYFYQTYGITLSEPSKACPRDSRHCHRAITVLLEYQASGHHLQAEAGQRPFFQPGFPAGNRGIHGFRHGNNGKDIAQTDKVPHGILPWVPRKARLHRFYKT